MSAGDSTPDDLRTRYRAVRATTERLVAPLAVEDTVVQSMPDASPAKWHLAHTTWFFETFVLLPHVSSYRARDERYTSLFNSYYNGVGVQFARARRGVLSRPTLDEVRSWRRQVDDAMDALIDALERTPDAAVHALIVLGTHHEEQHQELLLTDVKHALSENPLEPAYTHVDRAPARESVRDTPRVAFAGGLVDVGHRGSTFAFDNEGPAHRVFLDPYLIARDLVTNGAFLRFIESDGYRRPELWLSDGHETALREGWQAPLYWRRDDDGAWSTFTLRGREPLDLAAPVCHLSHYEADAFARFMGARLPTEFEWEHAAVTEDALVSSKGTLLDDARFHPDGGTGHDDGLRHLVGEVWEWTSSAYLPYPRFRTAKGAVGEYNGKFMSGQMVLRGASAFTPRAHARLTYRNFFQPEKRWQLMGIRLAYDDDN
jgi:ergothioneine biosynthesis protein EgtB